MSNPQNRERIEELTALHSLNLLAEPELKELLTLTVGDKEADQLMRDFSETSAQLTHELIPVKPPPDLREKIFRQLPTAQKSKIIAFPQWLPYAVAACLMALGIWEAKQIIGLQSQLQVASTDAEH